MGGAQLCRLLDVSLPPMLPIPITLSISKPLTGPWQQWSATQPGSQLAPSVWTGTLTQRAACMRHRPRSLLLSLLAGGLRSGVETSS